MDKVLVFKLKGYRACFRDFSETGKLISTTQIPNPVQFAGMLGAILGFSGYGKLSDINKYTNNSMKLPEFYEELKGLEYAIGQDVNFFESTLETINNHTGLYFTEGYSMQIIQEFLINPEYTIYIKYSEKLSEIYNELKIRLEKNIVEYQIYLGKPELFATIDYIGEFNLKSVVGENIVIDSWVNEELIDNYVKERVKLGSNNIRKFKNKTSLFTDIFEKTLIRKNKKTFIFSNNVINNINNPCFELDDKIITFNEI